MTAKLILLRHGKSEWNQRNLFTGWVDIPLSEGGIAESLAAGEKLKGVPIDLVLTSTLFRAQMTAALALLHHASGRVLRFVHEGERAEWFNKNSCAQTLPAHLAWELNERMYGDLQGLNKEECRKKFGAEQVQLWRRSYALKPPGGESLQDTAARVLPYFDQTIDPLITAGKTVLVVAHGNSLRALVMRMEGLSEEQVLSLEIATGEPLVFTRSSEGRWHRG